MTFLSDTDHGLMEDLRFYALFNSRLSTSGCWEEKYAQRFYCNEAGTNHSPLRTLQNELTSVTVQINLKELKLMDGWMDDLRFYVLFNSISVISGR